MNKIRALLIAVVSTFTIISGYSKPKYRLIWRDKFKGEILNDEYWSKIQRSQADWNRYMSECPAVYEKKNGILRLYAKVNDKLDINDSAKYITGGITTKNKKSIKYGKIIVKARMKGGYGTWPAIWLMPFDKKNWEYPYRAEIDIMECLHNSDYVYQTVHTYYTDELQEQKNPPYQAKVKIKLEQYNIYSVEILPDKLIFSINGKTSFIYPRIEGAPIGQYPFGIESYLMIDMQVGGVWVKTVDDSTLPAWMDIDYVEFYDYIP